MSECIEEDPLSRPPSPSLEDDLAAPFLRDLEQYRPSNEIVSLSSDATYSSRRSSESSIDFYTLPDYNHDVGDFATLLKEIRIMLCLVFPSIWARLAECSIITTPILFVGHLSTNELAGISFGKLFAAVTGLYFLEGLACGLDTLLPVMWRSRKPNFMGLWSQRMAIIMAIALLPIIGLWLNTEIIFLAFIRIQILQQGPEVARFAASYLRWFSFGMPAYAFNLIARRYFQAQGRFYVYSWNVSFVAFINLLLTYLLVRGPESVRLGFIGAPIATAVSYTLMSIISLIVGIFFIPHDGWHPISSDMFRNLSIISQLGCSSLIQIAPEWWAGKIMSFASSSFGSVALASQIVLTNTSALLYQVGAANVVNAAGVRLENLLVDKLPNHVETAIMTSVLLSIFVSFITSTVVLIFGKKWPYMFTSDEEVVLAVTNILPVIAAYQILEAYSFLTGAILSAKGDQYTRAMANFCAYYLIGFPIATILAFNQHLELQALWLGFAIALFFSACFGIWLCTKTDWNFEVLMTSKRVKEEAKLWEELINQDEERAHVGSN